MKVLIIDSETGELELAGESIIEKLSEFALGHSIDHIAVVGNLDVLKTEGILAKLRKECQFETEKIGVITIDDLNSMTLDRNPQDHLSFPISNEMRQRLTIELMSDPPMCQRPYTKRELHNTSKFYDHFYKPHKNRNRR